MNINIVFIIIRHIGVCVSLCTGQTMLRRDTSMGQRGQCIYGITGPSESGNRGTRRPRSLDLVPHLGENLPLCELGHVRDPKHKQLV